MNDKLIPRRMHGGRAVVESIRREGVGHVFCVPGESFTSIMDGFHDVPEIKLITNRHEGPMCHMAEAYAKATRNVGVAIVTRGPGATNASTGIHCAHQDSTPLLLLVGQVSRRVRGREALQEMNYEHFFGDMAKWVIEVNDVQRLPQILNRAFHVARSGRPGPVVVALPRDVLEEQAELYIPPALRVVPPGPDRDAVEELVARIRKARRPVLLVGNGVQYSHARAQLVAFVEKFQIPAVSCFRVMDTFPNNHPLYVGNLNAGPTPTRSLVSEADLVIVLGDRLSQYTTNHYQLFKPGQPLVQIDADAAVIGCNFPVELGIVADCRMTLDAVNRYSAEPMSESRAAWIAEYRARFEDYITPRHRPSRLASMESVMADIRSALPMGSIITVDAGQNSSWVQRYLDYTEENCVLAPNVGAMGYSYPAGIGAKLAHTDRNVVSVSGDGGFMMSMMEMATARQYGVKTTHLLVNNGSLATIRMYQEMAFPKRVIATDLVNPDFVAIAKGFGFDACRVSSDAEFKPAFQHALKSERSTLIEVVTDLEFISPNTTLTEIRSRAQHG